MNNWKLRAVYSGDSTMDWVTVNGYLAGTTTSEPMMRVIPFGDKYAAPLRTSGGDTFGPVSNQVPGICNGTFTHTTSGSATVSATSLTGEGSGATFTYTFLADGTLSTIVAASGGSNYKVGDKLRITTSASHGSQVIEFRLVDGSNGTSLNVRLVHDRSNPLPFPVHRARVNESTSYSFQVLDYRSSQVFPRPQDKLLDKYPDSAAAYGLRLLRSAYLGPCIRVQRSSDNALVDIGFKGDSIDLQALQDFVGEYDGRVRTWYDQSGNGNDAEQTVTSARPNIIIGGVLQTVNGKPALDFDGSDTFPFDSTGLDIGNLSSFIVCKFNDTTGDEQALALSGTTNDKRWYAPRLLANGDFNYTVGTSTAVGNTTANTNNNLHTVIAGATQGDVEAFFNGTSVGTKALSSGIDTTPANIGSRGTSAYMNGFIQEVVVYSSDQSERRTGIERNISNHYEL